MSRRFTIRVSRVSFKDSWKNNLSGKGTVIHTADGYIDVDNGRHTQTASDIFVAKDTKPPWLYLYSTSQAWGPQFKLDDDAQVKIRIEIEEPVSGQKDKASKTIDLDYDMLKPAKDSFDSRNDKFTVDVEIVPDFIGRRVFKGLTVTRSIAAGAIYNAVPNPAGVKIRTAIWAPKTGMDSVKVTNDLVERKYGAVPADGAAMFSQDPADKVGEHPYLRAKFLLDTIKAADEVCGRQLKAENTAAQARGEQIMHVFIAPEWYFRRGNRPHEQSDMIQILNLLKDLLNNDASYTACQKWMIIPGSIFWGVQFAEERDRWYVFNSVPVFWRGDFSTYVKRNEADIEPTLKKTGKHAWGAYAADRVGRSILQEMTQDCMYTIGQYRFGMEVCRDHAVGTLLRAWSKDGRPNIDAHLVTANDVAPNLAKKIVKDNGVFAYCDGNTSRRQLWLVRKKAGVDDGALNAARRDYANKYTAVAAVQQERSEKIQKRDLNQLIIDDPAAGRREKSTARSENKALDKRIKEIDADMDSLLAVRASEETYSGMMEEEEKQPVFEDQQFRLSIFALEQLS